MRPRLPLRELLAVSIVGYLVAVVLALGAVPAPAAVHTSPDGVRRIEVREGWTATVQPDPIGVPTQCFGATGVELLLLPPIATEAQCRAQLRYSLAARYEPSVRRLFKPGGLLRGRFTQHAFDGLTSAVYNLGTGLVTCASGFESMCRALHARTLRAAATALLLYDRAGGRPFLGLTLRRRAEAALIVKPMGRFELFTGAERHLILAYDRDRPSPGHKARLQKAMHADAVAIARVARRRHDWLSHRRVDRFAALKRRLPHPR